MKRIVLLILVLGGVGGAWHWRRREALPPDHTPTLYGNIDVRQAQLGFRVTGKLAGVLVEEGDTVEPGQLLAWLDAAPFENSLRAAEAARDVAKAQLEKAVNGPRPAEIDEARAMVEEKKAGYDFSEIQLERADQLLSQAVIPQEQMDRALSTRNAERSRLHLAQSALILLEEGTRREDIDVARAELAAAEAEVASAQTSLSDTRLHAPSPGVVTSRVREPGVILPSGDSAFVVTLKEPVWARAYVPEEWLGLAAPGREMEVYTDSRPGRPYRGVVGFVSPVAEFTPKSVETPELRTDLVYRLRVVIRQPDDFLRQGMPVTLRFADATAGE